MIPLHTPCCCCGSTETQRMCVYIDGRVYCLECGCAERDRRKAEEEQNDGK